MTKQSQVTNGKAFEYAIAQKLSSCLGADIRSGSSTDTCREAFRRVPASLSSQLTDAADLAVEHIVELERERLSGTSIREIWISTDDRGQQGDVRDVTVETSDGSIGISCKNNHAAFKHSRLSGTVDFVKKWNLDPMGCSETYWSAVRPIFEELNKIRRDTSGSALWRDQPEVAERFYWPVLDAFDRELARLTEPSQPTAESATKNLVAYVIGRVDFYKVIRRPENVTVQGFNFNGTLSTERTRGPTHVIGIDRLNGGQYSKTVRLNRGFAFNFRIHNASSRVEPSLKFDITAVGLPPTEIYVNHLRITTN